MWQWLRENYGWEAKRVAWLALALGVFLALAVLIVFNP